MNISIVCVFQCELVRSECKKYTQFAHLFIEFSFTVSLFYYYISKTWKYILDLQSILDSVYECKDTSTHLSFKRSYFVTVHPYYFEISQINNLQMFI